MVIVSGDGLLFEVFQGIFARDDWKAVLKRLAVAVVAGGSGNGVARSIAYEQERQYHKNDIAGASVSLAKGVVKPMDLMFVQTK